MKRILIFAAVLLALLFLARNVVAKVVLGAGIRAVTGLNVSIREIRLEPNALAVRDLTVHNPAGFPDRTMVFFPELYVAYDPAGFFKGKVHLKEVRVKLEEFLVERDQKGQLNLDSIQAVKQAKRTGKSQQEEKRSFLQVDVLQLRVGKVIYKDYGRGSSAIVQVFYVNLNEQYVNIQRPEVLIGLIVARALANTAIASLTNFDVKLLQGMLDDSLRRTAGTIKKLLPFENQ